MNDKIKTAGSTLGKFGSAAVGLGAGSFIMKKIPKTNIVLLDKLLPGLAGMLIAYFVGTKVQSEYAKAALMGLGLAGFADALKKSLGDKLPQAINDAIPTLSGFGYPGYAAVNQGDYPPSYYKDNAFQGLGTSPYALSGNEPLRGLRGLGTSPYALSGGMGTSPYALSGGAGN